MNTGTTPIATMVAFARLRWRLLLRSLTATGGERLGVLVGVTAACVLGVLGGTALTVGGRSSGDPLALATTVTFGLTVASTGLGIIAGVSRPIDPRVLAAEPLPRARLTAGMLVATAVGPWGLALGAVGLGLGLGVGRAPAPVVAVAVVLWMAILLLTARTATELLAMLVRRAPRTGYAVVGVVAASLYLAAQFGPLWLAARPTGQRTALADIAQWTPIGGLARVMVGAADPPLTHLLHLLVAAAAVAALWTVHLVAVSSGARAPDRTPPSGVGARSARRIVRIVGDGPLGAATRRRLLVRFRRPRTALETLAAGAIGMTAVLAPVLLGGIRLGGDLTAGATGAGGAVILGGAVQLAVLLVAGNSFGADGASVVDDLLAGGPRLLVAGAVRAAVVITAPLALVGPLAAAAVTGAWHLLVAGWLVAVGSLLAGAGGAVVLAALVPIPTPDEDHPFAAGELGRTAAAAFGLAAVLIALAVPSAPIVVGILWALETGSTGVVTLLAAVHVAVGWVICRLGSGAATDHLRRRTPTFVASVTPAR